MKDHVANPIFQEKRKIEMALEAEFPEDILFKIFLRNFQRNDWL